MRSEKEVRASFVKAVISRQRLLDAKKYYKIFGRNIQIETLRWVLEEETTYPRLRLDLEEDA